MALAKGVYRVSSKLKDAQCIDVSGASTSNSANVQLYASNDTNAQKLYLGVDGGGNADFRFLHSGKMLDVAGGVAQLRRNVQQYEYNDSRAQDWKLEDAAATATVNGVATPCYYIRSRLNQGYVLDAENGQNRNGTNLQLFTMNSTAAQQWCFRKDSFLDEKLAVPSGVGAVLATDAAGTSPRKTIGVSASTLAYPSWRCAGSSFQARWRYRGRYTGTSDWSGYSRWRSLAGLDSDEGWGDAWSKNVSASGSGALKRAATALSVGVDQGTYDRKEFQIEVRSFGSREWPAGAVAVPQHGHSCVGTLNAVWRPTLTVDDVTFTSDGLLIGYSSDFERNGNSVTLQRLRTPRGYLTKRPLSFDGLAPSGTLTVPFAELAFMPSENEQVAFSGKLTTIDCSRTQSFDKKIAYDTSHGLTVSLSQTRADGYEVLAKIGGAYAEGECHICFEQDGEIRLSECEAIADGFRVVPPFGRSYSLFAKARRSDGAWGAREEPGLVVEGSKHLFTFDGGYFEAPLSTAPFDTPRRSVEKNCESFLLDGKPFESVFFGEGAKSGVSFECVVPCSGGEFGANTSMEAFDRLAACDYAVYRSPYGERRDVAILGYDVRPLARGCMAVSLRLKERS